MLLNKYSILDLPKPPNFIDLQNQLDVLAFCAQQRNVIWTALNNVSFIFSNPGQFEIAADQYDITALVAYRAALETDLLAVKKAASFTLDHPRDAALPLLTAKPPALPKRRAGEEDTLSSKGEAIANADPLIGAIRDAQAVGACRRGFYVGLATDLTTRCGGRVPKASRTGWMGPKVGFNVAAALCLQRNNNADIAAKGAAIVKVDPTVAAARALKQPAGLYWLGFDIGPGIFGDPALGALGNTLMGPGSEKIRASLNSDGRLGFDAGRDFNLKKRHV